MELAALDAWAEVGRVPADAVESIRRAAVAPTPERVREIEDTRVERGPEPDVVGGKLGAPGVLAHEERLRRASQPAVLAQLRATLADRGMNLSEIAGFLACWQGDFLARPGTRLLLFLSSADYDSRCPLTIRPTPTARQRIGVILYPLE